MKAAVLHEAGSELVIETVGLNKPGPHEVLVRVAASGLCHSDLHFIDGLYPHPLPLVLGHEVAGIVEEVGTEVRYVARGDRVIGCLSVFCGTCEHCNSGRPALCSDEAVKLPPGAARRLTWNRPGPLHTFRNLSAFAEAMLVHENALVKIRPDMPLDRAALIGCAVITGFGAVVNTAAVRPGESVAVIGCGGVGMAAVNGAAIAGAGRIVAVDTSEDKLTMALEIGATDTINPGDGDPAEAIRDLTDGGVDHVIECLGLARTVEQGFQMLRSAGTLTIVGMVPFGEKVSFHGFDFLRERRVQGSNMGSNRFRIDMPRLIDHYMRGRLHLDRWVSNKIRLEDINDGFRELRAGNGMRSVIDFGVE